MSSKWRKHVTQQSEEVEAPKEGQQIVQAIGSRGGNLIEVQLSDGESTLCMLPAKFNKKLWIKRGGFLIVDIGGAEAGQNVTGTIVHVLFDKDVRYLRSLPGIWPTAFTDTKSTEIASDPELSMRELNEPLQHVADSDKPTTAAIAEEAGDASSDDDLPPLHRNENRPVREYEYTDDETSSEEE